jgi:phosphoenolpyruvate carboxylase
MEIAERYLELVDDHALGQRVFATLRDEHDRARTAVLEIVEQGELLDRHPVLQQSIRLRNPYVDPMNAVQIELLRRHRAGARTRPGPCSARSPGSPPPCATPASAVPLLGEAQPQASACRYPFL